MHIPPPIVIDLQDSIIAKYKNEYDQSNTRLLSGSFNSMDDVRMYIDGREKPFSFSYEFANTEEHDVIFKFSSVQDSTYSWFSSCSYLISIDLSNFDTSKVENASGMFMNCVRLTSVKMTTGWDNLETAYRMFYGIQTSGIFYYNSKYDYSKIVAELPSTWTLVPI